MFRTLTLQGQALSRWLWSQSTLMGLVLILASQFYRITANKVTPKPPAVLAHPDLTCYSCTASSKNCPVHHYKFPVAHLTTECYGCYKEWIEGSPHSTRQCLSKTTVMNYTEKVGNQSIPWAGCNTKPRPGSKKLLFYCLCLEDYCNTASTHHVVPVVLIGALCIFSQLWISVADYFNG